MTAVDSKVLEDWKTNSLNFSSTIQPHLPNGFAAFYYETINLEKQSTLGIIRLRFRKLFYHDLCCFLNPYARKKTSSSVYEELAKLIDNENGEQIARIKSSIEGWVRAGRRYNRLTTAFGTAILFVLPQELSVNL